MEQADSLLLKALYEGVYEDPLWEEFLNMLRARTGAVFTSFSLRTTDKDAMIRRDIGAPSPAHLHQLFLDKYAWDPLAYRHMQEGRIYALDELVNPSDPIHRALLDDLLLPQGITHMSSVRVGDASGVEAWLACMGGSKVEPLAETLIGELVPHLRIAIRSFLAMERERLHLSVASAAFSRLNFGWMLLDARCRIVDQSPSMEALLGQAPSLRQLSNNQLALSPASLGHELAALVKGYAQGSETLSRAFTLSTTPWMNMLVSPAPDRAIAHARPVAMAYIRGDHFSQDQRYEQLVDLFGLLPSEARLAWSIVGGLSITEAATALRISEQTARTYTKRIYLKTGARGQADLVRIVLTSVLAII